MAALDERAKKIADGLAAADRAKLELTEAHKRVDAELSQSRADNQVRLAEAERQGASVIADARKTAEADKARILAEAQGEADQDVGRIIGDPRISGDQVYGVFAGALGGDIDTTAQNFVRTLIDNDRLAVMPEIATQFALLVGAREGTADARITSAFPMDDAA